MFQSFFVSLNLPYSVVRGEEVALQVTVFNYESETQLVSMLCYGMYVTCKLTQFPKTLNGHVFLACDYGDS